MHLAMQGRCVVGSGKLNSWLYTRRGGGGHAWGLIMPNRFAHHRMQHYIHHYITQPKDIQTVQNTTTAMLRWMWLTFKTGARLVWIQLGENDVGDSGLMRLGYTGHHTPNINSLYGHWAHFSGQQRFHFKHEHEEVHALWTHTRTSQNPFIQWNISQNPCVSRCQFWLQLISTTCLQPGQNTSC